MRMLTTLRGLIVAGLSVCIIAGGLLIGAHPASAQFSHTYVPEKVGPGDVVNLFARWSEGREVDGFVVEVPVSWSLDSAALLRNPYRTLNLHVEELDESRYRIAVEGGASRSAELVLTLRSGEARGSEKVLVTPYIETFDPESPLLLNADRIHLSVHIESALTDPVNRVLAFADSTAQPLLLRADVLPAIDLQHAYALSFWLKTTGLNEIIFSTWDGDRHGPYPIEIVVDPAGRLRSFRGQPGEHQSIASKDPAADGLWHYVEVTNEPETGWMRLAIDGRTVDSLFTTDPYQRAEPVFAAVGGRLPGERAYFDGTRSFSGFFDELRIESSPQQRSTTAMQGRLPAAQEHSPATDASGRRDANLHLTFDDQFPDHLLQQPPEGVRRVSSDLSFHRPVEGFRAAREDGIVVLRWRAQDERAVEYVVERSRDGTAFEAVERIPVRSDEREYEYREAAEGERVAYYRLRQIFDAGAERVSGTIKVGMGAEQPESVTLLGNFPNPFNAGTTISYSVQEPSHVQLSVWDLSGQPVRELTDRIQEAGYYEIQFDAGDLPSGTYFIRLETPSRIKSHKMILMR